MTSHSFDHERLDVYRLSIDYVSRSFETSQSLSGLHRHARDQWLRAAQSIPLKIAEGNGKRSLKDRARFLDFARGSAMECAAIEDVLLRTNGIKAQDDALMKRMLHRIAAMLTRMAMKFDGITESGVEYHPGFDCDYKHRFAEHEHEHENADERDPIHTSIPDASSSTDFRTLPEINARPPLLTKPLIERAFQNAPLLGVRL